MKRVRIAVTIGTRPEAVKMAPVIQSLYRLSSNLETIVVATAQHRQMLDQVLSLFNITPDIDLDVMRPNQSLSDLTARVLTLMNDNIQELRPDLLLVQGDTTTVLASSLAAYYNRIPVGHVEAGLRSYDNYNPFPEEINRRLTTGMTGIHFAPTNLSRDKLLKEGVDSENIVVTGNTVVDALLYQLGKPFSFEGTLLKHIPLDRYRILLVTSHRRESWGEDLNNICLAIKALVDRFSDLIVVYPVHMNPMVYKTVQNTLGDTERVFLTEPLDYLTFINLMKRSYLILTDSGGVQEEAPTLKKPLLILRKLTERPEAVNAGMAKIVGANPESIVEHTSHLLNNSAAYGAMVSGENPFGDGLAGDRIAKAILRWSCKEYPLLETKQEFNSFVLQGDDTLKV